MTLASLSVFDDDALFSLYLKILKFNMFMDMVICCLIPATPAVRGSGCGDFAVFYAECKMLILYSLQILFSVRFCFTMFVCVCSLAQQNITNRSIKTDLVLNRYALHLTWMHPICVQFAIWC